MEFLSIAICGAVASVTLYRSLCSPYFIHSRMLFWVTFGSMWVFKNITDGWCPHMRLIAGEQFLAGSLLAMALVFYQQYASLLPAVAPARFTIEGSDDDWFPPWLCLWLCVAASMLFSLHATWMFHVPHC